MAIADFLKRNLPEFQRGEEYLDQYLDAVGEFFDDTKADITALDFRYNYQASYNFFMEKTLTDRGQFIPSRVEDSTKRRVLRDLAELNMKIGTLDSVVHAIRMAGLNPTLEIGWLPSPADVRIGYITDPVTGIREKYDVDRYVYTRMLYGSAVAEDAGVFFYGYRYSDVNQLDPIGPLAIFGERYERAPGLDALTPQYIQTETGETLLTETGEPLYIEGGEPFEISKVPVAKTPYIVVRFQEGESTVVTDSVTDPDTGEVYEYSTSEEFDIINEVLKAFLIQGGRATTTKLIIIASLLPFEETMTLEDLVTDDYGGTEEQDETGSGSVADAYSGTSEIYQETLVIGSGIFIGSSEVPYTNRFVVIDNLNIGDIPQTRTMLDTWSELSTTTYVIGGEEPMLIPMRGVTDVSFTNSITEELYIYGYDSEDDISPTLLATVPVGAAYSGTIDLGVSYIRIENTSGEVTDTHEIGLVYHART